MTWGGHAPPPGRGPIGIAAGMTAFEITQAIAAAIDMALGPGNGRAFNSFPPNNQAHVAVKPGNDVVFTGLSNTIPGVVVSVYPFTGRLA